MRILGIVGEGLRIARSHKSLWLFGFFLGVGLGGNGGGGQAGTASGATPGAGSALLLIAVPIIVLIVAAVIMRFLSEGALIEGVKRATHGERLAVKEGFREGWAHVGTVFRIKLVYFAASVVSAVLLALPCVVAARIGSFTAVVTFGIPAALVGVPWLVTLYIWHAFALRIAVLENRRVMDAIRKARLFFHGRIWHGLKLMIAALVGTLGVVLAGILLIAPFALLIAGLRQVIGQAVVLLAIPVVLPAIAVLAGVIGTYQSSVWTIGYLKQLDA